MLTQRQIAGGSSQKPAVASHRKQEVFYSKFVQCHRERDDSLKQSLPGFPVSGCVTRPVNQQEQSKHERTVLALSHSHAQLHREMSEDVLYQKHFGSNIFTSIASRKKMTENILSF